MSTAPPATTESTARNLGPAEEPILSVRNLQKYYPIAGGFLGRTTGYVRAVDGISFDVKAGETFGLVGESGCGKTTTGRSILRLEEPTGGEVIFDGRDIRKLRPAQLRKARRDMQIIFQDPYASLDPRMPVGEIIGEPLAVHGVNRRERTKTVARLLEIVGLRAADGRRYPHEFSGGQRQRIGIARALALNPKLVVCDEPVSALDVSIQSQIVNLLMELQKEFGLTYIFIAHDLSVVRHISDRVAVMYLGKMAELADADTLFSRPAHPYTQALMSAIPIPDPTYRRERIILQGDVPSP
ncbi:MAG: ABC transporter ATP-binding protein, partial [Dactylosporangium sp.]|nr:ABC transporter ATP-binding protein [Dactylosporangium sp.]